MLIAPARAVALSARRPGFLGKWNGSRARLRCQPEPWLNRTLPQLSPSLTCGAPGKNVMARRLATTPLSLPSDLLHPTAASTLPPGPPGSGRRVPSNLLTVLQILYDRDMAGMSHADVPVVGDKFESKEMSGWRQLWATFSPDVCRC